MERQDHLPPTVAQLMQVVNFKMVPRPDSTVDLPPFDQVGIVVKDVDKTVQYYSSRFGLGPWWVGETGPVTGVYKGREASFRLKLGLALSGTVEIELLQVLEGENALSDFLREKGEGLHHLRFVLDDIETPVSKLAECGIEPKWFSPRFAYLNSDEMGMVVLELLTSARRA